MYQTLTEKQQDRKTYHTVVLVLLILTYPLTVCSGTTGAPTLQMKKNIGSNYQYGI